MEEIIQEIMQSRHQMIYIENEKIKRDTMDFLEKSYPIKVHEEIPAAVKVEKIGLPNLKINYKEIEKIEKLRLETLARTYLEYSIATSITKSFSEENHLFHQLLESRTILEEIYLEFQKTRKIRNIYEEITYDLEFEFFIRDYKKWLHNTSYFALLIDYQKKAIILDSVKAINNVINSRVNKDISVKVFTGPNDYPTYVDQNGQMIESTHDYGIVKLEDHYGRYLTQLKK